MDATEAGGSNTSPSSSSSAASAAPKGKRREKDEVRVKREALQAVLQQCQRALELLSDVVDSDKDHDCKESSSPDRDPEIDELCDMIKYQVEGAEFLQKIEAAQASVHTNESDVGSSWDMVSKNDLWEAENDGLEQEDYVLVRQEDIVDGIAGFMAAYLLSLKQTKDLSPSQLQEALGKTLSIKKRKGKLRKAWDGTQVIYNVASWSATAIGVYQNPALLTAATTAFWTSCQAISKLL